MRSTRSESSLRSSTAYPGAPVTHWVKGHLTAPVTPRLYHTPTMIVVGERRARCGLRAFASRAEQPESHDERNGRDHPGDANPVGAALGLAEMLDFARDATGPEMAQEQTRQRFHTGLGRGSLKPEDCPPLKTALELQGLGRQEPDESRVGLVRPELRSWLQSVGAPRDHNEPACECRSSLVSRVQD